jgi:hypothetical protein
MSELGHSRRSDGQQGFADVRYAFNGDRICASQRTDAMCHEETFRPFQSNGNRHTFIREFSSERTVGSRSGKPAARVPAVVPF